MDRIGLMENSFFRPNRREVVARLAAALAPFPTSAEPSRHQTAQTVSLQAKDGLIKLRSEQAQTPIWVLEGPAAPLRFKRGDQIKVKFRNELPVPVFLTWTGIDGASAAEPLTAALPPVAPIAENSFALTLRQAGTLFVRLHAYGQARPSRPLPLLIDESEPISVDRDELFLIEDWRLLPDGRAIAPGGDAQDAVPVHTVNGQVLPNISMRCNERLRLRVINGFQRQVIALKFEGLDVRVVALDSQPAEPFLARNSALLLAPGGRADILVDAAIAPGAVSQILLHDGNTSGPVARLVASNEAAVRPTPLPPPSALPSNGLPTQLDLKRAQRVDLTLEGAEWIKPAEAFTHAAAPAFRAKSGGTVVLALINRAALTTVFHLHGHHFRLLDRLDDGWKPFWLDTLAIEPGQTQRVAFAAQFPGRWLMESVTADWSAPQLVRCYDVG